MKHPLRSLLTGFVLALGLCISLHAETASNGSSGPQFGTDSLLKEVFKAFKAYSGDVRIDMLQAGKSLSMEEHLDSLNGNTRTEIDLGKLHSPDLAPGSMDQMIALGFNPIVSICTEEEGIVYVIYPKIKAYASQRLPKAAAAKPAADAKKVVTELGEDVVGGHRCAKRKVLIPYTAGKAREVTLWAAKDLRDFPLKVEYKEAGEPVTITFIKVSFESPAASLFALPAGYTAYEDINALMQGEMTKRMSDME